ncbi:MAG: stage II sporulation protein P [Lachnospiraceae bacterium]|nr:stage II sporulation protein P [Lachnospiraceae bacterium]
MRKEIIRILSGIGVAVFAGSLFTVGEIPKIDGIRQMGKMLLAQTGNAFVDGQGGQDAVAEMLGGQIYFHNPDSEEGSQALVLAENRERVESVLADEGAEAETMGKLTGDVYNEKSAETVTQPADGIRRNNAYVERLRSTLDTNYLWKKFYIVDSTTSVTKNIFDVKKLLEMNLTMKKKKGKKQILIYHTHGASESFSDSRSGKIEDSIVGVGGELAKELEKKGYGVYHDEKRYDLINGKLERSIAYNKALEGIQANRRANPEIEVLIDLHRDSVGQGKHTYTTIFGKKTAIVMFFNGMSRTKSGEISYLYNPNLQGNLAFSLQLKCKAMEYYDGFTKPIYLKGYRYNLHLAKRSLLIELGNENNTVEEAKNAAAPLADVLDKVLSGQG